MIVVSDRVFH